MAPYEQYRQRLQERESRVARYERIHIRLGNLRLAIAVALAVVAWLSFARHDLSPLWLLIPVAAFVGLAVYHTKVLRRRTCADRAATVYRDGIARIEDRWAGNGQTGERFQDPHHIYSADLDLFGKGSLFELLSVARTRMGEETLAKWLLQPSTAGDIQERHSAISELRDNLAFREELAVLGEDARVGVHPEELLRWSELPVAAPSPWLRIAALVLALCFVAALVLWWSTALVTPLILVIVAEGAMAYRLRGRIERVTHGAEHAFADLDLLSAVLGRMEREEFASPHLRALKERLESHHTAASRTIGRLRTVVDLAMSRDNLIVRVFDVPLMYSVQVLFVVEAWQRKHGHAVRAWVEAVGEIEALLSLATYSYEHPADPFPELLTGAACFDAAELGHPLIAGDKCVRNSLQICADVRALLVSGSNMSGKSTLLRSVGIATVMAMAGAPVRVKRLRLTPLHAGASIRINDSLREGSSRFYAEIKRLRHIFDLTAGEFPLLFLIDEMLQGTNSHDRRIGAEAMVGALIKRGAIGLITTHDLALTDIALPLDDHLSNVHFEDELSNGKILFDYKLRDGIVTKSNGLELMRSIGLDV